MGMQPGNTRWYGVKGVELALRIGGKVGNGPISFLMRCLAKQSTCRIGDKEQENFSAEN